MIKKIFLLAFLILSFSSNAQKAQKIGFVDLEYILENIPEYMEAQSKINAKAIVWQNDIEQQQKEIESLKVALNNEKALLTKALIEEKEEDIQIKELDLKNLQIAHFGTDGDLFFLRQQLVKPIQDIVYNAVQDIASKRKFDFVMDKSSSLLMLYTNKEFDISELVLNSITRSKKIDVLKEKQNQKASKVDNDIENNENNTEINTEKNNEVLQQKIDDREAKKEALKNKIEDQKAEKLKKREEQKKAIEEKRQQRIEEIEAAKKAQEEKKQNN
ncbi:MAG: OmpH family outer membrane protein [Lutibacter sp.]|jgi:Skp family chaperone for outer membrane proteins